MTITEVKGDLFTAPQGCYLAHCISGDYALGAGIAKKFDDVYNMRFKLHKNYPIPTGEKFAAVGEAVLVDNVFNLITKPFYYNKPTLANLHNALLDMQRQCEEWDITKLAIPKLGCGLDRLSWDDDVKDLIEYVFSDTDIDITVYSL